MNKEPIGLYIFRFVTGFAIFAFVSMLYWSSVSLEDGIRNLRSDVAQLKNDVFALRGDTDRIRDEVLRVILDEQKHVQGLYRGVCEVASKKKVEQSKLPEQIRNRPHIDPTLPNLLHDDPFYSVTLPKLLGKDFKPHGIFHSSTVGKPDNLHPISQWASVSAWVAMCNVQVARQQFGIYETMSPDMAIKLEARPMKGSSSQEFWVHLRDDVYWQPLKQEWFPSDILLAPQFLRKQKVTAHDYKFYLDAIMNPLVANASAIRTYLDDIQEIEVIDDLTFVVRWKTHAVKGPDGKEEQKIKYMAKFLTGSLTPLATFVYKYYPDGKKILQDDKDPAAYRNSSTWAQVFSQHWAKNIIVSCGAWVFNGMSDRQINFIRNPDHYFPLDALALESQVTFKDNPDSVWQDFKSNLLDTYNLQPNQISELQEFLKSAPYAKQEKAGLAIERLDYLSRSYNYIGWNEARVFFRSKKVRQALTMAIDRKRIIRQNLNGLGEEITGPFFKNSPSYDSSIEPWPYDPQGAKRLLVEEGWFDNDGDGIIDKKIGGEVVPFSFSLTYYVKNPTAKAISEYISTALKDLGIRCNLNGVDIADLSAVFDDKNFDALFLGWALGTPPEDPRQLWYSTGAKEKGSSNAIGFENKEADSIIDLLTYEYNPDKREELYHKFDQIMHEESPYVFLYTPKTVLLYRDYLQNVFIPAERQDLIPGANVAEPQGSIFWIKEKN